MKISVLKTIPHVLLLISSFGFAQNTIESYVAKGIEYHDKGEFDKAINAYQKALKIDKNSTLVNYEIALSYSGKGDCANAIKHSSFVIKQGNKYQLPAYLVKGSCLDNIGKTKESIKLFKKAIKKLGDDHLLYYNLALDYLNISQFEDAEENAIKAILTNQNHTSSHLLVAKVNDHLGNKVKTLLATYYFLFLEPTSARSPEAYTSLKQNLGSGVSQDAEKPNNINVLLSLNPKSDKEFGPAELMVSLLAAKRFTEENKDKTDEEFFIENTTSFFTILGELKKNKNEGVFWGYYIPFFYDIAKTEHIEAFCHYISQVENENSKKWLEQHPEKLKTFNLWLKGH